MYGWVFGLAVTAGYVVGCNSQQATTPYADAESAPADHDEHEHEEGPHGGHIVEFGGDHSVHGEFVLDGEGKVAHLYLYGEDLKTPVEATAVTFHAEGDKGEEQEVAMEPAGKAEKASEFTAPLDQLPSQDVEQLFGHFHITVDGKALTGDLSHGHEGHSHDE
jgi:hypothetical protein